MLDYQWLEEGTMAVAHASIPLAVRDVIALNEMIQLQMTQVPEQIGLLLSADDLESWQELLDSTQHLDCVESHHERLTRLALIEAVLSEDFQAIIEGFKKRFPYMTVSHFESRDAALDSTRAALQSS